MGKHKVIRGLPEELKETSLRVAVDMDSDAPEAKARTQALREAMSRDDFTVLTMAAKGIGPRLMQQRFKGTTEYWRTRIAKVMGTAWRLSDEEGYRRFAAMYEYENSY